jgi:hypothetical protein
MTIATERFALRPRYAGGIPGLNATMFIYEARVDALLPY